MATMNYEKQARIEKGRSGVVFDRSKESQKYQSSGKGKKAKRTYLNVPYAEKDDAKCLGARWDAEKKKWYCLGDTRSFRQWITAK